jgi:hypothetical protein
MIEAEQTNASPAAIYVICAVVMVCLAFWLIAVAIASRAPTTRQRRMAEMTGFATGKRPSPPREEPEMSDMGRDLAGGPALDIPGQRTPDADRPERSATGSGTAEGRASPGRHDEG